MRIKLAPGRSERDGRVRWGTLVEPDGSEVQVLLRRVEPDLEMLATGDPTRWRQDATLLSRLRHPSLMRVRGPAMLDGKPALVYEDRDTRAARELVDASLEGGRVPLRLVAELVLPVARALAAVGRPDSNGSLVFHPGPTLDDLRVTPQGEVLLVGLQVHREGDPAPDGPEGTVPPEGEPGPARTSFALGALLVELLVGQRPPEPRTGEDWEAVLRRLQAKVLDRPDRPPPALLALLEDCLSWAAPGRPSVEDVIRAFEGAVVRLQGPGLVSTVGGGASAGPELGSAMDDPAYEQEATSVEVGPSGPALRTLSPAATRSDEPRLGSGGNRLGPGLTLVPELPRQDTEEQPTVLAEDHRPTTLAEAPRRPPAGQRYPDLAPSREPQGPDLAREAAGPSQLGGMSFSISPEKELLAPPIAGPAGPVELDAHHPPHPSRRPASSGRGIQAAAALLVGVLAAVSILWFFDLTDPGPAAPVPEPPAPTAPAELAPPEPIPEPAPAAPTEAPEAAPTPEPPAAPEPAKARAPEPAKAKTPEPAKAKATEPAKAKATEPAKAKATEPAKAKATEPSKAKAAPPAPTGFRVEFRSADPAVTSLEVSCSEGRTASGSSAVVSNAVAGPCRVVGRTEGTSRLAMVRISGAATFRCFADGGSTCE